MKGALFDVQIQYLVFNKYTFKGIYPFKILPEFTSSRVEGLKSLLMCLDIDFFLK